jgi:hypothetical protein
MKENEMALTRETAVDRYTTGKCNVPEFAVHRSIFALWDHGNKIEALALIRAAYQASLSEAQEILTSIVTRRN